MTRRDRKIRCGAAVGIALIGVACGVIIPGTLGGTLATALIGLGMIAFISLLFYEVGLTEDRDRAREERARAQAREQSARSQSARSQGARPHGAHSEDARPEGARAQGPVSANGRPKPSARPRPLDRMRGRRRRLP